MAQGMASPAASVAVPAPSGAPNSAQAQQQIPFRKATVERSNQLPAQTLTMTTSQQFVQTQLVGSGYIYGVMMRMTCTTSGNSAGVTFTEDAPWNAFASVILKDTNGELANVDGFSLYLCNLVNKQYSVSDLSQSQLTNLGITGV